MNNPRQGRVEERHFLNLPGFHAGAFVLAYVEDTSDAEVPLPTAENPRTGRPPRPEIQLEIADCRHRIELCFSLDDAEERLNSFHKIDTLIDALQTFRDGLEAEAALYRHRMCDILRAREALTASGETAARLARLAG